MSFELIPGKWVGKDFPVFVIAEIGQNHQGKSKLVRLLLIDLVTYFMGNLNLAKESSLKAKTLRRRLCQFLSDFFEFFT